MASWASPVTGKAAEAPCELSVRLAKCALSCFTRDGEFLQSECQASKDSEELGRFFGKRKGFLYLTFR